MRGLRCVAKLVGKLLRAVRAKNTSRADALAALEDLPRLRAKFLRLLGD